MILTLIRNACPRSAAAGLPESFDAPDGYESPIMRVVKVPKLILVGGETVNVPYLFLVGNTFPWKDWIKRTYNGVDYKGIKFGGAERMVWVVLADEASEHAETGLVAMLTSYGVDVRFRDLS